MPSRTKGIALVAATLVLSATWTHGQSVPYPNKHPSPSSYC